MSNPKQNEIDEFQKSVFLILRSIIDCKTNEPILPTELENKFYGFKLNPHKFYMIELAQFINEKKYGQIEPSKFTLNITSEKIDPNIKLIWNFQELTDFGASGAPEKATEDKGIQMKQVLVEYLVDFIQKMERQGWRFETK